MKDLTWFEEMEARIPPVFRCPARDTMPAFAAMLVQYPAMP